MLLTDEMVRWHHRLSGHEFEQTRELQRTGEPGLRPSKGSQRVGCHRVTEQQQQQGF